LSELRQVVDETSAPEMDHAHNTRREPPPDPREAASASTAPPAPEATERWKAWDRFLEATPETGFMQSSWWAEFRVAAGYDHFAIILKQRNAILGGAVIMKFSWTPEQCFYYAPEGPVLPQDESAAGEVFAALLEAIEERRKTEEQTVSHLRIEPRWQRLPGWVRGFRPVSEFTDKYSEPRNTLCIDLRASAEGILAQMKPKGRYNCRVAQRHGVSVVEDASPQALTDFLRIYEAMAAHQGIAPKSSSYFQDLVSTLGSAQRGSFFFAEYQGVRLAAALVVYFGQRATYFFGGSLHQHRHVMAPYLLHFEIMRRAKALGFAWYDLWGVAPEDQPEHPWREISVFKRKFGGVELKLVPTLDYAYDAAAYADYLAAQRPSGDKGFRGSLSSECTPSPENVNETCAR
jgi:peptidoglycan pentaglycine glycine transferase (the first glycine)